MLWNPWLRMLRRKRHGARDEQSCPHCRRGLGGIGSGMAVCAERDCGRTLRDAPCAFDSGTSDVGFRRTGLFELAEIRQREHGALAAERRNAAGGVAAAEDSAGVCRPRWACAGCGPDDFCRQSDGSYRERAAESPSRARKLRTLTKTRSRLSRPDLSLPTRSRRRSRG